MREVGLALITLGVIVLLFVAYQLLGTNIAEAHSQAKLKKSFAAETAANTAVSPQNSGATDSPVVGTPPTTAAPTLPAGGAIDHLVIQKIGVDQFVVQGTDEADLRRGPGHYANTVMPGELGNAAIAGHRTTYGAPFFRLNELSPGDDILITDTQGRHFDYKVDRNFVVSPNDLSVLNATPFAQLTLTTCNPRFSASSRLIVTARLYQQAALPPPSTTVPAAAPTPSVHSSPPGAGALGNANLGRGESKAWPPAIAYGVAVIGLWIAVRLLINRTRRWRRLAAYVFGITICLVPLWFCFENAALLLPQNI